MNQILNVWKSNNIEIKFQKCELCGAENYCQHQGFCVECMTQYSNTVEKITQKMKGKCGICGKNSKFQFHTKCQNSFFEVEN